MRKNRYLTLAVNPGSTSTKIGVFDNEDCVFEQSITHSAEDLAQYTLPDGDVFPQREIRLRCIKEALRERSVPLESLDAVSGRASRLPPMPSGTYVANDAMIRDVPRPLRHPALLGAIIAKELGDELRVPSYFVDPTVVDELCDEARMTGIPEIERHSIFHALNQKAVARRYAAEQGKRYADCLLVVAHVGGGISVGAHQDGRVIDVSSPSVGEGAMCPTRAGNVPGVPLVELCFSGKYTKKEMIDFFSSRGGMMTHCGHSDFKKLEEDIRQGDKLAQSLMEVMAYQIAKEIGAMAAVLREPPEAIILTGGMARSESFVRRISARAAKFAPVRCYPGEEELLSLVQGALRALTGEEAAREYVGVER